MIPRIIHYCWFGSNPMPQKFIDYIAGWRKALPDFQFVLWDDSCLPQFADVTWVREAYQAGMYAFVADYVRFYAVYSMGGIYMDTDVELVRAFEPLLDRPYLFGAEYDDYPGSGTFGAEPHCPLIQWCMEFYHCHHFVPDQRTLTTCKSPQVMHDSIAAHCFIEVSESMSTDPETITILPSDYLTAMHADTGIAHPTVNTRTIHHFEGSWCYQSPVSRLRRWLKVSASRLFGERLTRRISHYYH